MFDTCDAQGGFDRAALHVALDMVVDACASHDGKELAAALEAANRLANAIDGARVTVLPRFEDSAEWARDGHRTPVTWLVGQTGAHQKAARGLRRVCRDASSMPCVAAAAAEGALSHDHLRLLTNARREPVIEAFDRCEPELVDHARRLSADGLRTYLERWRLAALEALGENEPERPLGGSDGNVLRLHQGIGSRGVFDGELTPVGYATLTAAVDAELDRLRREGSLKADPRTMAELAGDILIELVERGAARPDACPGRPLIVANVDIDTLLRRANHSASTSGGGSRDAGGDRDGGESEGRMPRVAEILGVGPATNATIAELATRANLGLLVTDRNGMALWYGRTRRLATDTQRTIAATVSGGHCYWPGCTTPTHRCDTDHIIGWTQGGHTDIENLAPLCRFHNRLKFRGNYTAHRHPDGTITVHHPNGTQITTTYTTPPPAIRRGPPEGSVRADAPGDENPARGAPERPEHP